MKNVLVALGSAILFYGIGAFVGGWLVSVFSSNRHDRSVEAAMTGAFVIGPLVAVVAFVATLLLLRARG